MGAQVLQGQADYKGYSTGTVIHADALTLGATRVLDTEVAFSGATVAARGTGGVTQGPGAAQGTIVNEMEQVVQPGLPNTTLNAELRGDRSFGRGSGLEVGVGTTISTDVNANQILLAQRALASAPPSTGLITSEVGPIKIDPAVYASLVRGQAQARWAGDSTCVLGEELSSGLGYAADAQLLGGTSPGNQPLLDPLVATDAENPDRTVSQTRSVTKLVPQTDAQGNKIGDNFGLMTETRMTIAPVSLLGGAVTIELLGEWVLRAVATGIPGQAYVHYGPGTVSPETPVLRILQDGVVGTVLNLQDLLGATGLVLPVADLLEIAIGEDPRAIGGNASSSPTQGGDGTVAAGAVDVVRVQLLDGVGDLLAGLGLGDLSVLDVRVGHMEARAEVPAGGVQCRVPVAKTADKQTVNAGDSFTYNITVTNPFADCDLINVRVEDTITTTAGVLYNITGTNPAASATQTNAPQVVWNDIGPIGPKQSKTVSITVAIPANSAAGQFTNNAKATGSCATGSAQGGARITVPITGDVTVVVPSVSGGRELPSTGVDVLPRTGLSGPAMAIAGLGLLGAALGLRRFRSSWQR
ncbi:MAG: hypothetical protein ACRD0N_03595 [Acidimicrobiales bacterium]